MGIIKIKKIKDKPQAEKKIFENHISDKGIVYKIYEEFLQFNNMKI